MQSPPCPFVRRNLLAATSPPVVPAAANPQRPAGLCACPLLPPDCRYYTFGVLTGGFWVGLALVWFVRHLLLQRYQYRLWRLLRSFVLLGIIAFLVSGGWWLGEQHMFNLEGSLGQWNESRAGQHTGRRAMHAAAPLQPLPAARPSCSLPPPAARRACCPAPLCPPALLYPLCAGVHHRLCPRRRVCRRGHQEPVPHHLCKLLSRRLRRPDPALCLPQIPHCPPRRGPGIPVSQAAAASQPGRKQGSQPAS